MTTWDGNPNPVARELLQNCLDAAQEADRDRADVHFTIKRIPLDQIPGIDAYRRHFAAAEREHGEGATGPAKTSIERIRSALSAGETGLLLCRDNGVGLNDERMGGVLGEGSSRKPPEHTGSYGVGHLTAFSASDLRYVLYAGRARWADSTVRTIVSGHAIVASQDRAGPHGYWIQQPTLFDANPYPELVPPILARELDQIDDTGSVVCIAGFNSFREDSDPAESLRLSAAVHFLAAVHGGNMEVHVHDGPGVARRVDRSSLPTLLEEVANKQDLGRFGGLAYRAWRTLDEGVTITIAGVEVRFRFLEDTQARDSRVHVFRNGMWITSDVRQLSTRMFNGFQPFDAVVLLEQGELYTLVCGAEGPEHQGITPKRLGAKSDRDRLNALLREIRNGLRTQAGEEQPTEQFTPPDFAVVRGAELRDAERVRRRRPRHVPEGSDDATVLKPDDKAPPKPKSKKRKRRRARRSPAPGPAAGRAAALQAAVVPRRNARGEIEALSVRWRFRDDKPPAAVGVRVLRPSGSDETCEQPLRDDWVPLAEIYDLDGTPLRRAQDTDGSAELVVPPDGDGISIRLVSPLPGDASPALDIVRRPAK